MIGADHVHIHVDQFFHGGKLWYLDGSRCVNELGGFSCISLVFPGKKGLWCVGVLGEGGCHDGSCEPSGYSISNLSYDLGFCPGESVGW